NHITDPWRQLRTIHFYDLQRLHQMIFHRGTGPESTSKRNMLVKRCRIHGSTKANNGGALGAVRVQRSVEQFGNWQIKLAQSGIETSAAHGHKGTADAS